MADYPVDKTNAIPEVTPIKAKHINNLEDKVGIDGDPNTSSLDNRTANLEVDHEVTSDPNPGAHREGTWRVGGTPVLSTGAELNKLNGTTANVNPTSLNDLTGGGDIGVTYHRHDNYLPSYNDTVYATVENNHRNIARLTSDSPYALVIWVDASPDTLENPTHGGLTRVWFANHQLSEIRYRDFSKPMVSFGQSQAGIKVKFDGCTCVMAYAANYQYDGVVLKSADWNGTDNQWWDGAVWQYGQPNMIGNTEKGIIPYRGQAFEKLYKHSGGNAYKQQYGGNIYGSAIPANGAYECFEWISPSEFAYGGRGGHDGLMVEMTGVTRDTVVTMEVTYINPKYDAVGSLYLGAVKVTSFWGILGDKIVFDLWGRVYEISNNNVYNNTP